MRKNLRAKSGGFTLIEMIVVFVITSILILILAPTIIGSRTSSQALSMLRLADAMASNYVVMTSSFGVTTEVNANPIPGVGLTVEDVLFQGATAVSPPFSDAYARTGVKALSGLVTY